MTALFDNLLDEIYTATNRPDLEALSKQALKAATLKLHQSDFFKRDLIEVPLEFSTPALLQSLAYRDLFPGFRRLSYLRKYSTSYGNGVPGEFFDLISPEMVLDSYQIHKENVCYLAGESLEVRSDTADQFMLAGYWVNPNLTEDTFDSWIAMDHKYAVVCEAARRVCGAIGQQERAADFQREFLEQRQILIMNNVGGV